MPTRAVTSRATDKNPLPVRWLGVVLAATIALGSMATGCASSDLDSPGGPTTSSSSTSSAPAGGDGVGSPSGSTRDQLSRDGRTRTFRLFVPAAVAQAGRPAPLVVALHGGFGNADQFAATTGLEAAADRAGFVVVFVDALSLPSALGDIRTWNAGRCCGPAAAQNIDDVGDVVAIIDRVRHRAPIDASRVFAVGHSNGAMLSWRLACERADVFRGIVAVAGSLETTSTCSPSRGVDVLAIHGDADQNHPLDGGPGTRSVSRVSYRSMAETMKMWTTVEGCAPGGAGPTRDGALTRTRWSGCADATTAQLLVIAGADHPWPGSAPAAISTRLQGTPTQLLDATSEVVSLVAASG